MVNPAHNRWNPKQPKTASLYMLPAELRNEIYGHLYTFSDPILVHFHQGPASRAPKALLVSKTTIAVALFSTSRQNSA